MAVIDREWMIFLGFVVAFIIILIVIARTQKPNHEKYNIGMPYADPRMIPEFPTYDGLAHANVWTRYDLESDVAPYSPYLPCYDCGGDEDYYHI